MSHHLSSSQLTAFQARTLTATEMVTFSEHLHRCSRCRFQMRQQMPEVRHGLSLSTEQAFRYEHFDYEQLVRYADQRMKREDQKIAESHLRVCASCREDVRSFLAWRQESVPEMRVRYRPEGNLRDTAGIQVNTGKLQQWWASLLPGTVSKPAFAITTFALAAAALLTISILTVLSFRQQSSATGQAQVVVTSSPPATASPALSATPDLPALTADGGKPSSGIDSAVRRSVNRNRRPESSANQPPSHPSERVVGSAVIALVDRGTRIELDASGRLSGLSSLSPQLRETIRETLLTGELRQPEFLAEIRGEESALRGSSERSLFRLLSPGKGVIATDRPTFRWEMLSGTTGWRVQIVDAGQSEVIDSGLLPASTTKWRPAVPLKRGVTYTWIVTALRNGEEITAPSAAEAERKFRILNADQFAEIARLRTKADSHLALGILYAQAGMMEAAANEFRQLQKDNPHSQFVRRLHSCLKQ